MVSTYGYIIVYGSNIGDKVRNVELALSLISRVGRITGLSRVYITESVGVRQECFVNGGVIFETDLLPLDLLKLLKEVEIKVGRRQRFRWGPREIDLDIVWFSGGSFCHRDLRIPHPEWSNRRFVIEILLDLGFSSFSGYDLVVLREGLIDQYLVPVPCVTIRMLNLLGNFGSYTLGCEDL